MRTNRTGPGSAWALGLIICACACAGVAGAATIVVAPSGSIADGLAAAAAGDTVLVSCGRYYEQGLAVPDGVVLRSESGQTDCVVISPAVGSIPVLVCNGASEATVIKGLTIAPTDLGFTNPADRGTGAYCEGGAPRFRSCRFTGLTAGYGGAVYCRDASPSFEGCEFLDNQAMAAGGAVAAVGASHLSFDGCLLSGGRPAPTAWPSTWPWARRPTWSTAPWSAGGGGLGAIAVVGRRRVFGAPGHRGPEPGAAWAGDAGSAPEVAAPTCGATVRLVRDPGRARRRCATTCPPTPCSAARRPGPVPGYLDIASPCVAAVCGPMGATTPSATGPWATRTGRATGVPTLPEVTELTGNRPNPFNPSTVITFALRRPGAVAITVYDVAGRAVKRLVAEALRRGHPRGDLARRRQQRPARGGRRVLRADGRRRHLRHAPRGAGEVNPRGKEGKVMRSRRRIPSFLRRGGSRPALMIPPGPRPRRPAAPTAQALFPPPEHDLGPAASPRPSPSAWPARTATASTACP